MPEEGSPPQMDPCQHLRDRFQQLGQEIRDLQELLDSGEAPPTKVERMRAEIRRLEAERSQTERELDECEQEAKEPAARGTFGQPTFQSDDGVFNLDISPDKRALTLRRDEFEISVGPNSPAPMATRAFFLVVPLEGLEGSNERVEIDFIHRGAVALTTEGATAALVYSVNDQTNVVDIPENTDTTDHSFEPSFRFTAPSPAECRISVLLLVGRDSKNPDSKAFLGSPSIDAEFART